MPVLAAISPADPLFGYIYYVLGGWFIGSSAALFLCGILVPQITTYFSWYTNDPLAMRAGVAVVFVLSILKAIQAFAITWINSILYMQDVEGTYALQRTWIQVVNIPLGAIIAAYCQLYYCYRLYKLSGRWWVVAPIIIVILLALIGAFITASVIATTGGSTDWFAVHVVCTFATDLLITAVSTFLLMKAREKALKQTKKLIGNVIKVSCQTALPATAAMLIELICWGVASTGNAFKPTPMNSITIVLLDMTPFIYVNCMLYLLNTRRTLRLVDGSTGLSNSINGTTHPASGRRGWRTGAGPNGALELGTVSVHVRTEVDIDGDTRTTASGIDDFDNKKADAGF
ncbi:hypothetical protein MKEN_01120000 [Mycena kentingensis (nom. inval.)]|nr:hypothetical protein MKEN_01120000 [Mycena kentingensis (nom. inval.)]